MIAPFIRVISFFVLLKQNQVKKTKKKKNPKKTNLNWNNFGKTQ